jgi:uncharacterized membrane protein YgdD (TMEM256/DUF423 family)
MTTRTAQLIGSALALLGIILGAFGAHFLRHTLTANGPLSVEAWQTGTFYQWIHALAFLALAGRVRFETALCWLSGVVLFSGSLYILALDPALWWAGPVTPMGGTLLIVGWGLFIANVIQRKV